LIVVDTSAILAFMNSSDTHHPRVSAWLESEAEDLATTPLVIAEVDHLIAARGGPAASSALRADLVAGAYLVQWWPSALKSAVEIAERYASAGVGLTDASLVALAQQLDTIDIATLDERHFRTLRPLSGADAFRLLPADN
jgi:predicted nucleic acid-binding protein